MLVACSSYLTAMSKEKMKDSKAQLPSGYALGPPWIFKGRALYQLHLVKSDVARALIPKEFKLHEAFGYTLGGFFLAQYDDSPVAKFDELVVIAGIVRGSPSSCAWAARVLVNSEEACRHGQQTFGLPSHVGMFTKSATEKSTSRHEGFLRMLGMSSGSNNEVSISESNGSNLLSLCSIKIPQIDQTKGKWMGPKIRISLPSFSGRTIHNPLLLKYACEIECRVRAMPAIKVFVPGPKNGAKDDKTDRAASMDDDALSRTISILSSKPLLALEFNFLNMRVNAPIVVPPLTPLMKQV